MGQEIYKNSESNRATYVFLSVGVLAIIALLVYVLFNQAPLLKLNSLQDKAKKIALMPKEKQASAKDLLLIAINKQLEKKTIKPLLNFAELGLSVAKKYNDEGAQLTYYKYLNDNFALDDARIIDYIQLLYKLNPKITRTIEPLIMTILNKQPRQAAIMYILGLEAIAAYDYDSAIKALEISLAGSEGELKMKANKNLEYAKGQLEKQNK